MNWPLILALNAFLLRYSWFFAACFAFGLLVLAWYSMPVLGNAIVVAMQP